MIVIIISALCCAAATTTCRMGHTHISILLPSHSLPGEWGGSGKMSACVMGCSGMPLRVMFRDGIYVRSFLRPSRSHLALPVGVVVTGHEMGHLPASQAHQRGHISSSGETNYATLGIRRRRRWRQHGDFCATVCEHVDYSRIVCYTSGQSIGLKEFHVVGWMLYMIMSSC